MTEILMTPALHAALLTLSKAEKRQACTIRVHLDVAAYSKVDCIKRKMNFEAYHAWIEAAEVVSRVLNSEIER
jgi:hypothetical protein